MSIRYLTAESVCAGHPDKVCDFISDRILDACLRKDKCARVAVETMATKGHIFVAGEITCDGIIDIRYIVRDALRDLGYNPLAFRVSVHVHKQSSDIAGGVDMSVEARNGDKSWYANLGAGDQGSVIGYACRETTSYLPMPLVFAHSICRRLDECRKEKIIKGIGPDGKCQVTVAYEDGKPVRVETVVISVQHNADKDLEVLRSEIISEVLWKVFKDFPFDENTEILINPSGRFVIGGPAGDTGLTGRKLMVDTYGGLAPHGGGAFSGKDPTKVDRSGAYMARYIAKNIINADYADRCQVTISYAIGKADPVAVQIDTFGTGKISDEVLAKAVKDVFNMRPGAIIEQLYLRDVRYSDYAHYGHFGNGYPSWEHADRYGYRYNPDTRLPEVVPEQAEIIRDIFRWYLEEDQSVYTISKRLNAAVIPSPRDAVWTQAVVRRMLRNETYTGNMMLGKFYSDGPLTQRHTKNYGERPMFFAEETHEAIIDTDTFRKVQERMAYNREYGCFRGGTMNSFTGKVICGVCGQTFGRATIKREKGNKYPAWTCKKRAGEAAKCRVVTIMESDLETISAGVLGLDSFSPAVFEEQIDTITVSADDRLLFRFRDGRSTERYYPRRRKLRSEGKQNG